MPDTISHIWELRKLGWISTLRILFFYSIPLFNNHWTVYMASKKGCCPSQVSPVSYVVSTRTSNKMQNYILLYSSLHCGGARRKDRVKIIKFCGGQTDWVSAGATVNICRSKISVLCEARLCTCFVMYLSIMKSMYGCGHLFIKCNIHKGCTFGCVWWRDGARFSCSV